MMTTEHFWLSVGFLGQAFFSMRFLVQWIASERKKESVIPVSFWFFSIGGGLTLLIYAVYRLDPVFIIGQGAGLFVYLRNLFLIRHKQRLAAAGVWPGETVHGLEHPVGNAADAPDPDDPGPDGAAVAGHPGHEPAADHPVRLQLRREGSRAHHAEPP